MRLRRHIPGPRGLGRAAVPAARLDTGLAGAPSQLKSTAGLQTALQTVETALTSYMLEAPPADKESPFYPLAPPTSANGAQPFGTNCIVDHGLKDEGMALTGL
jgi:hypothetical protein